MMHNVIKCNFEITFLSWEKECIGEKGENGINLSSNPSHQRKRRTVLLFPNATLNTVAQLRRPSKLCD